MALSPGTGDTGQSSERAPPGQARGQQRGLGTSVRPRERAPPQREQGRGTRGGRPRRVGRGRGPPPGVCGHTGCPRSRRALEPSAGSPCLRRAGGPWPPCRVPRPGPGSRAGRGLVAAAAVASGPRTAALTEAASRSLTAQVFSPVFAVKRTEQNRDRPRQGARTAGWHRAQSRCVRPSPPVTSSTSVLPDGESVPVKLSPSPSPSPFPARPHRLLPVSGWDHWGPHGVSQGSPEKRCQ